MAGVWNDQEEIAGLFSSWNKSNNIWGNGLKLEAILYVQINIPSTVKAKNNFNE